MRVSTARALEAAKVLGVDLEDLNADEVTAAYREAAKGCHPNAGSYDPARWAAIGAARTALSTWLSQPTEALSGTTAAAGACRACGGSGRVRSLRGFNAGPQMFCAMCGGTGTPKKHDREQ